MPIREYVVVYDDTKIGKNLDTGHFIVLRGCEIGDDCCIWSHCTIDPDVRIGNRVKLHNHVYVAQGTIIEDDVFIGPGVRFLNDRLPPRYDKSKWQPPVVRRGAIIQGHAVIGPGVVIGERAIIASGAVVIHSVPPRELWAGIPARKLEIA